MQRLWLGILVVFVTGHGALAQHRPSLVPSGWIEISKDAETKTRTFQSPDGWITLVTQQSRANPLDLSADLSQIANRPGEIITYQRQGPTWIAVSGYRSDNIFYRKSNLACGGTRWNNVEFLYPRAEKQRMDSVVTSVARNMTRYARDC
jgi:hypothetical protein